MLVVLCLLALVTCPIAAATSDCDLTVNITGGVQHGTNITFDNLTFTIMDYFTNESGTFGCVCRVDSCLQDCCPSGYYMNATASSLSCVPQQSQAYTNLKGVTVNNIIHVKDNNICREDETKIKLNTSVFEVELVDRGSLKWEGTTYDYTDFCVSTVEQTVLVVLCVVPDSTIDRFTNYLGMIISMPFLFITFLVYLLLPDRNLHQKALMFYVLALLFAYILLVTINLASNFDDPWCSIFGYTTVFSFMVSFFWMNVICFDIWYTFSGGRGFAGSKKSSERKRLIVYGVYAFGVPLLLVILIYVLDKYLPENSEHRPRIGSNKCFLSDGWPNLWYFYGEAGILVLANIIFFVLTALKIRKVKQETSMLKHSDSKRHSYEKDKQNSPPLSFWFNLYVKLLFAMGVNWSMEVISWLVNWQTNTDVQYIFYITDFFNAVYGLWIFLIFVFKRKIWMLLKKRYYNFVGKPHLAHTVTSTQTRTSNYSSTNYSTADTHLADRGSTTNGRQVPEEMALRQVT